MRHFAASTRRPLHSALAILVAAALAHCSWEEARELAQRTRMIAQHRLALPSPIEAPVHDCDHESGCICRGATVVHAIDATHHQPLATELLPPALPPAPMSEVADIAAVAAWSSARDYDFSVPPISARQLRALLASLVI